eukprot:TRINITY_DN11882_c0_g2_i2.p1 TRINITY_DN11882_c0_g2~~TRINITY_DN11882_c0_g2_i2.p1  ORF type:complete len:145 (-),score=30.23 TRINITY_DN11882_c0_g2_i2:40-474(-)
MLLELLNSLILVVQTMESHLSGLLISHPKSHIVNHEELLRLFKKLNHLGQLRLLYKLGALYNEVLRNQFICIGDLAYSEARMLINTCYQLIEAIPHTIVGDRLLLALRTPLSQMLGRMDISTEQAKAIGPVSYTHLTLPTICSV